MNRNDVGTMEEVLLVNAFCWTLISAVLVCVNNPPMLLILIPMVTFFVYLRADCKVVARVLFGCRPAVHTIISAGPWPMAAQDKHDLCTNDVRVCRRPSGPPMFFFSAG